jgi:hypothetical protein
MMDVRYQMLVEPAMNAKDFAAARRPNLGRSFMACVRRINVSRPFGTDDVYERRYAPRNSSRPYGTRNSL